MYVGDVVRGDGVTGSLRTSKVSRCSVVGDNLGRQVTVKSERVSMLSWESEE